MNFLNFLKVKFIIWDMDGTLWSNEKLGNIIKDKFVSYLQNFLKKSRRECYYLFNKVNKKFNSWSKTISFLTRIEEEKIILEIENNLDRTKYLKKDKKLIEVFEKLRKYRHLILTNATYKNTLLTLQSLGFSLDKSRKNHFLRFYPFEMIFSIEKNKAAKPRKEVFLKILKYTKMPPERHLMVGDSFEADIKPAKILGMKTCLIGSKNKEADICLKEIYELPKVFSLREKLGYFLKNMRLNLVSKFERF